MRQPPGGDATGCLSGHYVSPGVGLPLSVGMAEVDDFAGTHISNRHGWLLWVVGSVQGSNNATQTTPTAATEYGLTTFTPSGANKGGTLYRDTSLPLYTPSQGMLWACKLAASAVTGLEVWSGFTSSATGRTRTADGTSLIGIRLNTSTTKWEGVVKDGAGSGNETAVELADAVAGTYIHAGWAAVSSSGSPAIQFFTLETGSRVDMIRTDQGDAITANIPTGLLPVAIGVYQTAQGSVSGTIDLWQLTGRAPR